MLSLAFLFSHFLCVYILFVVSVFIDMKYQTSFSSFSLIQRFNRLREETEAIPKAKKLIDASLRQQKKLQTMSLHVPSCLPERTTSVNFDANRSLLPEGPNQQPGLSSKIEEEPAPVPKEKKGRGSPPLWYITANEFDSLPSYMRGRLTLDKVNAAINDMAAYAEVNAQLIGATKKKMAENLWERALEVRDIAMTETVNGKHFFLETDIKGPSLKLDNTGKSILTEVRDIAMTETVKGKHFFLETDIKGPSLKLDNTGKSILTVVRHLGRISETRVGHNRVIILLKPH